MFRQKKKGSRNKPDNVIFAIFAIFVIFNVSIFQCYYIKNSVEKLLLLRNAGGYSVTFFFTFFSQNRRM
jgi:hypothetical protein